MFELLKEYDDLPKAEVLSCLKAEDINYDVIESNHDVVVIDTDSDIEKLKNLDKRLSLTFNINKFFFDTSNDAKAMAEKAKSIELKKDGSIAIKCRNRTNNVCSQDIIKTLATIYTKNRVVKLDNPDIEIRAVITDEKIYVGEKINYIYRGQFENRKTQKRPFFSPISLHPKIARCLVNLSCVKKKETILDPFCGTGGILIEAGLMGIKICGSDIEEKMVKGCKKNLDFYKIRGYFLYTLDIAEIISCVNSVDGIVTDFPYGMSTTTKGEDIKNLYERSFRSISRVVKNQGKIVAGVSRYEYVDYGSKYLDLVSVYPIVAHKNLTRFFAIYQKNNK